MSVAIDGYLKKKSRSNSVLKRAWNKRWFVLAGNILSYSNSSKDKKTSGTFNLADIHDVEKKGSLEFQLVFPERKLLLKAADMVEARRWVAALEAAMHTSEPRNMHASLRDQAAHQDPPPSGYDFRGRHSPTQARAPQAGPLPHEEVRMSQSSAVRGYDGENDVVGFSAAAASPPHKPDPQPHRHRGGGPPSPRTLLARPDLAKQSTVFGKALANQRDGPADDVSEISEISEQEEAEHAVAKFTAPSPTPPKRAPRPDPGPTRAAQPPPQPPSPEHDDVLSITSTPSKPEVAPLRVKEAVEPDTLALSPQNHGKNDSPPAPAPEETPVFAMDQVEDFDSEPEDEEEVEVARSPAQSTPTRVQQSKPVDVVWSPDTPEIDSPPRKEDVSPIPMQAVAGVNVDQDFLDDDWDSEDEESLQSPAEPLPRHVPSPVERKAVPVALEASKPELKPQNLEASPRQPANAGVAVDADFLDDDWDSD